MLLAKAESEKKAAEEKKEAAPPAQHVYQAWNFDEANGMYYRRCKRGPCLLLETQMYLSGTSNAYKLE